MKLYIREMQKFFNLSRSSVLYYEEKGILSPKHLKNGYREYSNEDVDTLFKIVTLRNLGYSSEEIKDLLTGGTERINIVELQAQSLRLQEEIREKEQLIYRIKEFMATDESPTLIRPKQYYISRQAYLQDEGYAVSTEIDEINQALIRFAPHVDVCCLLPQTVLEEEQASRLSARPPLHYRGIPEESIAFLGIDNAKMQVFSPSLCLRVWTTHVGYRESLSLLGKELKDRDLRPAGDVCMRSSALNMFVGTREEARLEILIPVEQIKTSQE